LKIHRERVEYPLLEVIACRVKSLISKIGLARKIYDDIGYIKITCSWIVLDAEF
jgi:hypothetical protein